MSWKPYNVWFSRSLCRTEISVLFYYYYYYLMVFSVHRFGKLLNGEEGGIRRSKRKNRLDVIANYFKKWVKNPLINLNPKFPANISRNWNWNWN